MLTSSGCAPILPVYINPDPKGVYHKEIMGGFGSDLILEGAYVEADFQKTSRKNQNFDGGIMMFYANTRSLNSANVYGFFHRWHHIPEKPNPFASSRFGMQVSNAIFKEDIEGYNGLSNSHFEYCFGPGIYKPKFNFDFPLRAGAGLTIPAGRYVYLGAGLQTTFFMSQTIGLNMALGLTFGLGAVDGNGSRSSAALLVTGHILKAGMVFRNQNRTEGINTKVQIQP